MRHLRSLLIPLLGCAILAGGLSLHAQGNVYSPDQINQMVAPIALYPDALMSQVLMASTYPNQVIEADRWVQANPGLAGGRLDQALATATWDPSVISLSKFPTVLNRMAQNITWTTDLGNAFLYQRTDVMNAVQNLRSAAYENGTLRTTEQERVGVEGSNIAIQPSSPEVIYVPTYQPSVVYGSYWNYPSYYYPGVWDSWPGYSFVNGFAWGMGNLVGNILFGGCDWGHHDVWMDYGAINNCSLYSNTPYHNEGHGGGGHGRQQWVHNSGVDYANGGTGQPYGGRSNGRINGVSGGNAVRRTEPAAVNGPRGDAGRASNLQAQRGRTGDTARGADPLGQQGATREMARGANRSAVREPRGYSEQGRNRQLAQDLTSNSARGANRPAAHGPTGYAGQNYSRPAQRGQTGTTARDNNRPTVNGSMDYSARGANRPSVNSPSDYSARGANRPAAHGPTGYTGQNYSRPAQRGQTGITARDHNRPTVNDSSNNSARSYNRPSVGVSSNYSARGANRPTASGPSGYTRSGNSHSYARPSAPSVHASAPSGHAGGGRGASAGSRGGKGARGHR